MDFKHIKKVRILNILKNKNFKYIKYVDFKSIKKKDLNF